MSCIFTLMGGPMTMTFGVSRTAQISTQWDGATRMARDSKSQRVNIDIDKYKLFTHIIIMKGSEA